MMLRYSFGLSDEADTIESAVEKALNDGHRTADIAYGGEKILWRCGLAFMGRKY
jgi:3-isopropylmalate dehydrogenase